MKKPTPSIPAPEALPQYDDWVRAMLRRMIADEHAAEDGAQDLWVAALERPPGRTVRGWVKRVAGRVSARWRWRQDRESRLDPRPFEKTPVPEPSEIVEREAARRRVVAEVLALPAHYRDVVVLRFYRDLSVREIARQLSLPVETVRTGLRTVRVDEQGRFQVKGLAPGDYVLRAYHTEVKTWGAQEVISLDRGRTASCSIYLMVISGLHVTVCDPDGKPITGARIRIRREDGVEIGPLWNRWAREFGEGRIDVRAYWFTDGNGVMNRRTLAPGKYTVEASRKGYRTGSEPVRVMQGWSASVVLQLEVDRP